MYYQKEIHQAGTAYLERFSCFSSQEIQKTCKRKKPWVKTCFSHWYLQFSIMHRYIQKDTFFNNRLLLFDYASMYWLNLDHEGQHFSSYSLRDSTFCTSKNSPGGRGYSLLRAKTVHRILATLVMTRARHVRTVRQKMQELARNDRVRIFLIKNCLLYTSPSPRDA